ncbi:hypothetical protein F751_4723 [Auxenochlorella protothecoides]|uniref:Uncharacterized protein n=1 Tax=Auxenochlorella protothecoides TaxID=3075 RepID=A0A087SKH6_AUXPR|nr:hypothetical protein F751_4723 [Auxenochlorella protothecoides]KFM26230.1 hypothetical protein F751_4723 [Auxenochlorella protothecoides]
MIHADRSTAMAVPSSSESKVWCCDGSEPLSLRTTPSSVSSFQRLAIPMLIQ